MSMNYFKVEKGLSIPKQIKRRREPKYPFADMQPGDSFSFLFEDEARIRTSAYYYSKRTGAEFTLRKDPQRPGYGRCWRVDGLYDV